MRYADILVVYEPFQPIYDMTNEPIAIYNLISAALKKKDKSKWERLRKQNLESNLKFDLLIHRLLKGNESEQAIKAIKGVFPVHPYTAYLITVIARYFGSIERVLSDFLHNSEKGFSQFIREHNSLYIIPF